MESENPDRLVTIEKTDKPEEKEPEPTIKMMKASEEFAAQEATAAPTIQNVQQAAKSTTMDQGTGQSQQRARVTWQKELMRTWISSSDIRPSAVRRALRS